ncbi:MAG: phosphatase PAP2 family protein [Opitutales bacterium]
MYGRETHSTARDWPLLPHEILFGLFLVVTWLRLVWRCGFPDPDSLVYLAFIVVNAGLIAWNKLRECRASWFGRLLYYPIVFNLVFSHMKQAIPRINQGSWDEALQRVDNAMVGGNLSLKMEPLATPWLTEVFSLSYILFFPYIVLCIVHYFRSGLDLCRTFTVGLFTIYGIGFLGYSLIPAMGPHLHAPGQFTVPLQGWVLTVWNARLVEFGSSHVDVFPSLHCAVSCYLLVFDREHCPGRFKVCLLPCVLLWISTIYLRYHYLVDLICGFALAAFALWLAGKYSRRQHVSGSDPSTSRTQQG